jgi:hypothetical protein
MIRQPIRHHGGRDGPGQESRSRAPEGEWTAGRGGWSGLSMGAPWWGSAGPRRGPWACRLLSPLIFKPSLSSVERCSTPFFFLPLVSRPLKGAATGGRFAGIWGGPGPHAARYSNREFKSRERSKGSERLLCRHRRAWWSGWSSGIGGGCRRRVARRRNGRIFQGTLKNSEDKAGGGGVPGRARSSGMNGRMVQGT